MIVTKVVRQFSPYLPLLACIATADDDMTVLKEYILVQLSWTFIADYCWVCFLQTDSEAQRLF